MWVGIHRVHTIVGGWRLRISRILFWCISSVGRALACHARGFSRVRAPYASPEVYMQTVNLHVVTDYASVNPCMSHESGGSAEES